MAVYCDAVTRLATCFATAPVASRGLAGFRSYLDAYAASDGFLSLRRRTKDLTAGLASVRYSVAIDSPQFRVSHCEEASDYSADIEAVFARFRQGEVKDYRFEFPTSRDMNHIEAAVLQFVSRLHPRLFADLAAWCADYRDAVDSGLARFDREIQFYIAWREHVARLEALGLACCYPRVVNDTKEVRSRDGFDLALADKLRAEGKAPVCNDFHLNGSERMIVVSGPNQGGKTTFARTFGQLHYLASLGLPVPGREAQLFLFDRIFTHFEREESAATLRGKLQDDLIRIHRILEAATSDSIVIMNEIFTSTALHDALMLSRRVATKLAELDVLGVWVTFLDELASLSEQTVSMVSTVRPDDPASRTFRIIRRPADGLSHAMAIAEKHRLTYRMIRERIAP